MNSLLFSGQLLILFLDCFQFLYFLLMKSVKFIPASSFLPHDLHQRSQISVLLLQSVRSLVLRVHLVLLLPHCLLHFVHGPLECQHLPRPFTSTSILVFNLLIFSQLSFSFPKVLIQFWITLSLNTLKFPKFIYFLCIFSCNLLYHGLVLLLNGFQLCLLNLLLQLALLYVTLI